MMAANKAFHAIGAKARLSMNADVGDKRMNMKYVTTGLLILLLCLAINAAAVDATNDFTAPTLYSFSFSNAPLKVVLINYSKITGTIVDIAPGVADVFTFSSETKLEKEEALALLTKTLAQHRIQLVTQSNGLLRAEWIQ